MLGAGCPSNNPWNRSHPCRHELRAADDDAVAAAVAAAAMVAVRARRRLPRRSKKMPRPHRSLRLPSSQRRQNHRRNKSNRQSACTRCRCAPRHRSKNFNRRFPLPARPGRTVRPSARPLRKPGRSSSRWSRRWNRWKRFWSWSSLPSARKSPTNVKSNCCDARCTSFSRRTGSAGNPGIKPATNLFAAITKPVMPAGESEQVRRKGKN